MRRTGSTSAKKAGTAVVKRARPSSPLFPPRLTVYRHAVPTAMGDFILFTDQDGSVRWCCWGDGETDAVAEARRKWYKGTTVSVAVSDASSKTASLPGADAAAQLHAYFNPSPTTTSPAELQRCLDAIHVVLPPHVTPFQRTSWDVLRAAVPAGQVTTYKGLGEMVAKKAGATKVAPRGIGQSMGLNPIPVIIPCHRVVASTQGLNGYGCGLRYKAWLLRLERAPIPAEKIERVANETRVSTPAARV